MVCGRIRRSGARSEALAKAGAQGCGYPLVGATSNHAEHEPNRQASLATPAAAQGHEQMPVTRLRAQAMVQEWYPLTSVNPIYGSETQATARDRINSLASV